MLLGIWLLAGLALGILVRDIRRALVIMVAAVVAMVALMWLIGSHRYPLSDSGGLLALPILGIVATAIGHRLRRTIWTKVLRRT